MGLLFSVLFHLGTKEKSYVLIPRREDGNVQVSIHAISEGRMGIIDWLKEPQFYQVGVIDYNFFNVYLIKIMLACITFYNLVVEFSCFLRYSSKCS